MTTAPPPQGRTPDARRLAASGVLLVIVLALNAIVLSPAGDRLFLTSTPAAETGAEAKTAGARQAEPVLTGSAERGRALFLAKGCINCHSIGDLRGTTNAGPNLSALPQVAGQRRPDMSAEVYIRESLLAPQAFVVAGYSGTPGSPGSPAMPALPLTGAEIADLIAFLLAPRAGW